MRWWCTNRSTATRIWSPTRSEPGCVRRTTSMWSRSRRRTGSCSTARTSSWWAVRTHAHGVSRESTRQAAVADAHKPEKGLTLDPDAEGPGLRDWFASLPTMRAKAAAFDTRIDMPAVLTGRASKGIGRLLRKHGFDLIDEPESFLVTRDSHLETGEATRAQEWGRQLGER